MRQSVILGLCGAVLLGACGQSPDAEAERALNSISLIDNANLNEVMMTMADPAESVAYFRNGLAEQPGRIDLQRGLGKSLVRAGLPRDAVSVWREIVARPDSTNEDRVNYADALIRVNEWDQAGNVLNAVPPTHESYERYRLEAILADSREDWARADSFYETAAGLTTRPASVLNNWGYSKIARGDYAAAERLLMEALSYDPNLFVAKNNLVMARGAQRNYALPMIRMTQTERAQLLHTLAMTAIRQGDVVTGQTLLRDAIDTHPQHFEEAVRALRALDGGVVG